MSGCIFCGIAKMEEPAGIVYEDGESTAFLDSNPFKEGITGYSEKHFDDIWDIEPTVLSNKVRVTKELSKKMAVALETKRINTFSASDKPGQDINHLHLGVYH